MNDLLWQTKLAARLHDPAEKALILMRTAEGHEGGTSRTLLDELLPADVQQQTRGWVQKADRWASAADRAAFPNHDADGRWPQWQQVRFDGQPVLIHPLTGQAFDLKELKSLEPEQIKAVSLDHFRSLTQANDARKTLLAYWRFGPELQASELDALWRLTPADTRVPDHTIWDHLDLTSAFAGAFAGGEQPALLAVSLGPVQSFIAAARSTSDLWAGSHLLSRLAWEAMRVICNAFGPDAILFPRLRGVPQVDLWLQNDCGLPPELFADCDWQQSATDANPLFSAALPNRFTAIVPQSQVQELAEKITHAVQQWALQHTEEAWRCLLAEADVADSADLPAYAQIRAQLAGFPEVHWAAVPWSLASSGSGLQASADAQELARAMAPFYQADNNAPGFLGSEAWQLMSGGWQLEDGWFWRPNPGALYPALHELLERVLAAAKATRSFGQTVQQGWPDSLTGEVEWLTTDRAQLALSPGQRKDTIWAKVAKKRKFGIKAGEHLGALSTLKRLWPTLFVRELESVLGDTHRFVVSTHTMAMAGVLAQWLQKGEDLPGDWATELAAIDEHVALPPKLASTLRGDDERKRLARNLPTWFETAREASDETDSTQAERQLKALFGHPPEAYYALILMDGDRMGAWLSAADGFTQPHGSSFHPKIRAGLQNRFARNDNFDKYAAAHRAPNPAWHMAISEALNNFSLTLASAILHRHFNGRILYAGGDDLMAMLPVGELLAAMAALRAAYSGIAPASVGARVEDAAFHDQKNGFVHHKNQVLRLMGEQATASMGAVIAHHQTPFNRVLRELHAAEQRAKNAGGRDAFSITVLKRSGGAQRLTANWMRPDGDSPMTCLRDLAAALYSDEARRTAYNAGQWMSDLPVPGRLLGDDDWCAMVAQLLAAQFARQKLGDNIITADIHARRLARLGLLAAQRQAASANPPDQMHTLHPALEYILQYLSVAEFLAREGRHFGAQS